ncbi:MAG: cytochrome P450 [Herpetosiphonaceae bacterium]|nr:MAG: cytochrome P450 [Herpetosiphonaceae bacterium]
MSRAGIKAVLQTRKAEDKTPPGPRGNLLWGSASAIRRDILGFFLHAVREYGDIIRYRFMIWPGYFVNHPDYVKHILIDNNRNYNKNTPGFETLRWIVGNGLVTSEGDLWLRQRRLMQPSFHKQRLASFATVMTQAAAETAESWEQIARRGEVLDVDEEMMRLTLKIAGLTLFSMDISGKADTVGQAFTYANKFVTEYLYRRIPRNLPLPRNRKFEEALRTLDQVVSAIIRERRARGEDTGDLLSMLLHARDEDTGEGMDDRQLRDEVMTLLLAGHETTANALTWTWYLLSKHPLVMRRLQSELAEVLGGRLPTVDDLPKLCYTRMVIDEALRLYPPAWMMSRQATEDDEIGGYRIPAKTIVFFSPYVVHRHPSFWENPEGFDPERFTPERSAGRPRFAYLPFGGGPRLCIGNNFALMEAQLILATLAQRYQLELVPGHRVEPEPLITLRPRYGLRMVVKHYSA